MKFLGHELGSQTIYKEKGNEITTLINGTFDDEMFRKGLDKFIEKYIICQKCKYPEMIMLVKKGIISGRCNACGHKNDLDNTHKLATFIIKNPPDNQSEFKKGAEPAKNGKKLVAVEANTKEKEKVKVKSSKTNKDIKDEENEKKELSDDEVKLVPWSKEKTEDYTLDSKKIGKFLRNFNGFSLNFPF